MPTRWKKITLKGNLSPDNGIDTDGDTLTDWEEVDTTKIKIKADKSIELHQKKGDIFVSADESNILWKVFMRIVKEKINEESN